MRLTYPTEVCQIVEFIIQLANHNWRFALFPQDPLNKLLNSTNFDFLLDLAMQLFLTSSGRENGTGGYDGPGEIVKTIREM